MCIIFLITGTALKSLSRLRFSNCLNIDENPLKHALKQGSEKLCSCGKRPNLN